MILASIYKLSSCQTDIFFLQIVAQLKVAKATQVLSFTQNLSVILFSPYKMIVI